MNAFSNYIAKYAPQYNNDRKLRRYRDILIKLLERYWRTDNLKLYKHQHTRISEMMHKEYPDIIVKRQ